AFLLFFPTISSGPIDRFRRFVGDWEHKRTRGELLDDLDGGLHRIMTGFLYKFIVAALIKQYWLDPAAGGSGLGSTVSYRYAFSRWNSRHHLWGEGPLWRAGAILLTFQVVCFGLLLFSGRIGPGGYG